MKGVLILTLCVSIVSAQFGNFGAGIRGNFNNFANRLQNVGLPSVPLVSNVRNFADFAAQTGKQYTSEADRRLREGVFSARQSLVNGNNAAFAAGRSAFESSVNAFADLTNAEFLKQLTGLKRSPSGDAKAAKNHKPAPPVSNKRIPDSFDWRKKGGVTPVKFQGDCGSCWSFAVTGAIEGHYFRKTGRLPILSEQNLIDCGMEDDGLAGCDGGFQEYAFNFVTNQKGIAAEQKYPYLDRKDTCHYQHALKGAEISGFATIPPNDEEQMKKVVATLGPLACSVYGLESLLLYKRGIYDDEECNNGEVNHSILVVGYGTENGQDYWIIKNSWDKTWGEEGYFRLPRGKNFCSIASECSYPIIN